MVTFVSSRVNSESSPWSRTPFIFIFLSPGEVVVGAVAGEEGGPVLLELHSCVSTQSSQGFAEATHDFLLGSLYTCPTCVACITVKCSPEAFVAFSRAASTTGRQKAVVVGWVPDLAHESVPHRRVHIVPAHQVGECGERQGFRG